MRRTKVWLFIYDGIKWLLALIHELFLRSSYCVDDHFHTMLCIYLSRRERATQISHQVSYAYVHIHHVRKLESVENLFKKCKNSD